MRRHILRLFRLFDADGNGAVDFTELASGLSLLCGGSREQRVRAAFSLYDTNGDGVISLREMVAYFSAVFRVTGTAHLGVTPAELAEVTAEQAFEEADQDRNGNLSFDEFKAWFSQGGADGADDDGGGSGSEEAAAAAAQFVAHEEAAAGQSRLGHFVRLARIDRWAVSDAFELFATAADGDGVLDGGAFERCFRVILAEGGALDGTDEEAVLVHLSLQQLFELFDADGNGVVDFAELASGLSVLCGGSRVDKVEAAFALYDVDGNGVISLDEMKSYLKSVFTMLFALQVLAYL